MIAFVRVKLLLVILTSFFVSLFLYNQSLNYYFFQDDFFEINISKANSIGEYLSFFKFRNDIIAYRPISLQHYFFSTTSLFGLNPVAFRFISFCLLFLSAFLIVKVIKKITKNNTASVLASFLWITSSIHFMSLSWIAAAYNIIGTFFWLLTATIFLKFLETQKPRFYLLTIATFLLCVGSFEFSVTWPAIFIFYYFYMLKNPLTKAIILFSPFIVISTVYIILRLLFIKVPQITEYTTTLNIESAKAILWYILWSFNIPEEFKKQIVDNLIVFNPKFFSEYWPLVAKTFISALLFILAAVIFPAVSLIRQAKKLESRTILFFLVWFFIGILPVLLIPNHTFSMYLTLASIGIYGLISYLLSKTNFYVSLVVLAIWVFSSATTISFYKINSWIVDTQKTARKFSQDAPVQFPYLPTGSSLLYPLDSKFERQALLENHAIRTIYNDPSLSIYYNKESLISDWQKGKIKGSIYLYLPR